VSVKSAIGLSCLSVMTPVCPAASGEQAIARVCRQQLGRREEPVFEPYWRLKPGRLVIIIIEGCGVFHWLEDWLGRSFPI